VKPIAPLSDLERALAQASAAANRDGRPHWVAVQSAVPPHDPLRTFEAGGAERFFWERPAQGVALATSGAALTIETHGPRRFEDAARAARACFAALHVCGDAAPPLAGPLLVGGFAFADAARDAGLWSGFPAGRFVLPERMSARASGAAWRTLVQRVEPGADASRLADALRAHLAQEDARGSAACGWADTPGEARCPRSYRAAADRPPEAYSALVDAALGALGAGDLEKVVVARRVRLDCEGGFSAVGLLDTLRASYPSCATFAVGSGDASFVGATPERLLRLAGRRVETSALAGSAPRGCSPEEDARLALELVESKKEQAEHAVVVRELRQALAPLCRELRVPEAPELLRLEGIQHLETPLCGTLNGDGHVLDLAGTLHPTSAVAGAPRQAALAWLERHESLERGWYGGAVGFVEPSGGGELAVALRSALLRGATAHLFAGAGIVAGSRPQAELQETQLKLRALFTPLLEI
jgi:isochorismate synthase